MGKVRTRTRVLVTTILAIWMAATGCGASLTHAHGGVPSPSPGNGTPTDTPCVSDTGRGPFDAHRHIVVMGIELPGELPPTSPATGLELGLTPCDATATSAPDPLGSDSPQCAPLPLVFNPLEGRPARADAPRADAPNTGGISFFALRTVCGVLRS